MCQELDDIMYSVKETARMITCPTESDEVKVKVKVFRAQRDQQFSFVRERVHRQRLGRTTPNVQEHKWWSQAVEKHDFFCLVKNTAVSELEFCRGVILRSDNWNLRRDGDEASLERTGIRKDSREPCRQSICEGMGIQTKFGTDETCNAEVNVRTRRRGEEAKDTCLCEHEFEPSRPDDKVSYIWNPHERLRNVGSETQKRRRKTRLKQSQ